ncbi:hypothetical protein ASG22_20460 [Chryseobacterium sp. Leaf405]|uniref:hypothetical protein n=1 Tax=Chryseobacterium sp. Leaf405 TaxID=1736367 RepID=UPI0006F33BDD|nr:hypothetical protein [Chryseobacterium sp. Leaf405]KQT27031.1 hypothetical protein ASG22_20460 [Chryseobacterium sp. Leaf405]
MHSDLIYNQNLDEIDTSEAYFGKIILFNEKMLVPYINLGISNHDLNRGDMLKHINFCYAVFIDIDYLKIDDKLMKDNLLDKYDSKSSIYLGGDDLLKNQNIYGIEIQAKNAFLQLRYDSKITENYWLPVETPNFKRNMDEKLVNSFMNNKNLPDNLSLIFQDCEESSFKK